MPLFRRKTPHPRPQQDDNFNWNRWWETSNDPSVSRASPASRASISGLESGSRPEARRASQPRGNLRKDSNSSASPYSIPRSPRAQPNITSPSPRPHRHSVSASSPRQMQRERFQSLPVSNSASSIQSRSPLVMSKLPLSTSISLSQMSEHAFSPRALDVESDRMDRACGHGHISNSRTEQSLSGLCISHTAESSASLNTTPPSEPPPQFPTPYLEDVLHSLNKTLKKRGMRMHDYIEVDELLSGRMFDDEGETLIDCARDKVDDEDGEDGVWRIERRERREAAAMAREMRKKNGNVFGSYLQDLSDEAIMPSIVGGYTHYVPMIAMVCVEEIYKTGIYQPHLFRTLPRRDRLLKLVNIFDQHQSMSLGEPQRFSLPTTLSSTALGPVPSLHQESTSDICALLMTYLCALPDTIIHRTFGEALWTWCVWPSVVRKQQRIASCCVNDDSESEVESHSEDEDPDVPSYNARIREMEEKMKNLPPFRIQIRVARQILFLLPPRHFSLLLYLMAFFVTLPVSSENGVELDDVGRIFGPSVVGGKSKRKGRRYEQADGDFAGGIQLPMKHDGTEDEKEMKTLTWLVTHWDKISVVFEKDGKKGSTRRRERSLSREAKKARVATQEADCPSTLLQGEAVPAQETMDQVNRPQPHHFRESLSTGKDDVPVVEPFAFSPDVQLDSSTETQYNIRIYPDEGTTIDSLAEQRTELDDIGYYLEHPNIGSKLDTLTQELLPSDRLFKSMSDDDASIYSNNDEIQETPIMNRSGNTVPKDTGGQGIPASSTTNSAFRDFQLISSYVTKEENFELQRKLEQALAERDDARRLVTAMRKVFDGTGPAHV